MRTSRFFLVTAWSLAACESVDEARVVREAAAEAERVEKTVREDLDRIRVALEKHAPDLAPGLAREEPDAKRATVYRTFSPWRQLKAGGGAVFDLQTAPILFLGVVDAEGKMVVRDRDPENMYRKSLRGIPSVANALSGAASMAHGTLPDGAGDAVVLAVPIRGESGVAGAVVAPVAYAALARRLERQLTLEANRRKGGVAKAPTIRVALYAGRQYFSGSIQPELDPTRPSVSTRGRKLGKAGAYTDFLQVQSRPFGLAVRRFGFLDGDADAGLVVWRSDPVRM